MIPLHTAHCEVSNLTPQVTEDAADQNKSRGPQDDWTGLKNRSERKKLQNRLNVRAHRRRKAFSELEALGTNVDEQPVSSTVERQQRANRLFISDLSSNSASGEINYNQSNTSHYITSRRKYKPLDYGGMVRSSAFPLSLDHLIPLIQYNLVRACVTNATILSLLDEVPLNCNGMWGSLPLFAPPVILPESLAPTELQERMPHDAWVDLLPDNTLRDNTLKALGHLDMLQLSRDLSGSMCRGDHGSELRGMLVWSDPWTPEGWEVSEGFARKWGFLLEGCWRLLASTNNWRQKRNEPPLLLSLSQHGSDQSSLFE